jgi:polyhydroxybutyrate depolymerase
MGMLGLSVLAQEKSDPPPKPDKAKNDALRKKFDKNGDGKIDDDERKAIGEFLKKRGTAPGATTPSGKTETVGDRLITELEYPSKDGKKIPAVLSMPQGDGPFPCVVTIHGGSGGRDLAFIRTLAAPNELTPTVTALNEQPWAVLSISYRAGNGALFGAEQDDVVAGIRHAKTLPRIDPERIAVFGGSHGGHLALRAAELMGKEFRCVVAGSPWMTNPFVPMRGKADEPPLSKLPEAVRTAIMDQGRKLYTGITKGRGMSEKEAQEFLTAQSIEANAEKIVIPSLFLTSLGDEAVPHLLVQPTIDKLKSAGRDVTVYTAMKSPHGFYWGREGGGARIGRGGKTKDELSEEAKAREMVIGFLKAQFGQKPIDQPSPPQKAEPMPPAKVKEKAADKPKVTPEAAKAVRGLKDRMANMPVPGNLDRRMLKVGDKEREYFIHIPESVKGKPAPVVFALHGGATSTGLAMHLKADYTGLADKEGFVVVYPSGVNGWNIGSHDANSVKRRTSDADDLGFFKAMFDTLEKEKIADPKRIYVTGGSNGGVMTYWLVSHFADRIAGAGVMVATLPKSAAKDWPKPSHPVPMMIALGTEDTFKPWNGTRDQFSANATVEFWRKQNGCAAESLKWDLPNLDPKDGTTVHAEKWEGKASVLFYTMKGHGHGWPKQRGKEEDGTGPKTQDISGPEEFWKFLKNHSR